MAEVAYSSEDITVLGGPSKVTLELEVGPPGNRGVFVMFGFLNPNDDNAEFIAVPQLFDLYVVVNPASEDYLQMYQYLNKDGTLLWDPAIRLRQNVYSTNRPITFSAGSGRVDINLADIGLANLDDVALPGSSLFFNVQASFANLNLDDFNPLAPLNPQTMPIASSVVVQDAFQEESGELSLPIFFNAAEFDGTDWSPIDDKTIVAYLTVIVVDPSIVAGYLGVA
jgi:hypothetical protein